MNRHRVLFAFIAVTFASSAAVAQATHPIVGAWERFAVTDTMGVVQASPVPSLAIFSADGFYSVTSVPHGRPKLATSLATMSKDDLVARFRSVLARRGKYTVSGNTLTRTIDAHSDPNEEGMVEVQTIRIEADVLTLIGPGKFGAQYRRAK